MTTRQRRTLQITTCILGVVLGAGIAHLNRTTGIARAMAGLTLNKRGPTEGTEPPPALHARKSENAGARTQEVPEPAVHDPGGERFKDGMVITGHTPHRLVLFTFDDGPHWKTTPRVLDMLDAAGVHAVFFVTGDRLVGQGPRQDQQRALVREIADRGHIIGNHTYSHQELPLLHDAEARAEISGAEDLITQMGGVRPWLLRLPGGGRSERIDRLVAKRGYTSVLWNLGGGDFQVDSPEMVFDTWKRVLERREREDGDRGGIVLLHDTHDWSVAAFGMIYDEIMSRNCALLAQHEELYDIVDDPSLFFVPRGTASESADAPAANPRNDVLEGRQSRLRVETAQRCGAVASL